MHGAGISAEDTPAERVEILLDISRTVARARLPQPTGIDRVERAYIDWAIPHAARFLARVDGQVILLTAKGAGQLLALIEDGASPPPLDMRARLAVRRNPALRRAQTLVRRLGIAQARGAAGIRAMLDSAEARHPVCLRRPVYLNVGHDNLSPDILDPLAQARISRVVMLHDVIPLDHPEFARVGTLERFHEKFQAAMSADALLFNSAHTAARVAAYADGPLAPHRVVPLGLTQIPMADPLPLHAPPTFAVLGTIEPRKNHLMLMRIWQQLYQRLGPRTPHLRIIGRRGWAGREVMDLLDRDPLMGRVVFEDGALPDDDVGRLLRGCRALLFPSLAEGYGLPLAEALQLGVPAIASDLPALREVAGDVPDWLAPDDEIAWADCIAAYAADPAPRRTAQLVRMAGWQAPSWDEHFKSVENLLETIMVQVDRGG